MRNFTEDEFQKVGHTLGINVYHAQHSKNKKDKVLPAEFYRNYYNYGTVGSNEENPKWIEDLSPFIDKWTSSRLLYFGINEAGIAQFKKQFQQEVTDKYVPLTRSQQRYLDWLATDGTYGNFAEFLGIKKKLNKNGNLCG